MAFSGIHGVLLFVRIVLRNAHTVLQNVEDDSRNIPKRLRKTVM